MVGTETEYARTLVCVEVDGWEVAHRGEILYTEGLGPCIGLAIIDTSKNIAALGHLLTPNMDPDSLKGKISTFLSRCSIESVKVYVRGGCRILAFDGGETPNTDVEEDRRVVLDALLASGLSRAQIDVAWSQNPDDAVDMQVDPQTGTMNESITNEQAIADYGDDVLLWGDHNRSGKRK